MKKLAEMLNVRAGIVEHGIFIGMADKVICALSNGSIEEIINSTLRNAKL